jgi:hypothetical protein
VPSSEGGAQQIPLGLERDKYGRRASVHIEALKKMNPKGFVEPHTLDDPMDDDDIDDSAPLPETLESFIHSVATPRCSLVNSFRHLDDGCVLLDIVQSVVGEPVPDVDRNSTNTERIRHALLFLGRKDGTFLCSYLFALPRPPHPSDFLLLSSFESANRSQAGKRYRNCCENGMQLISGLIIHQGYQQSSCAT